MHDFPMFSLDEAKTFQTLPLTSRIGKYFLLLPSFVARSAFHISPSNIVDEKYLRRKQIKSMMER